MLQGALQRIIMYHAGHSTKRSHALTKLLLESTDELVKAFKLLSDVKKNQREILDAVHKVSDNESRGDLIYRADIGILFDEAAEAAKEHGAGGGSVIFENVSVGDAVKINSKTYTIGNTKLK